MLLITKLRQKNSRFKLNNSKQSKIKKMGKLPLHVSKMMTLWRRKKNEWALSPSEELFSPSTTTTLHKHQLNPKANQKKNWIPLKSSFSMNFHGCSRQTKMKSKGWKGKSYHTKDNYGVPTRRKRISFEQMHKKLNSKGLGFLEKKWVEMKGFS